MNKHLISICIITLMHIKCFSQDHQWAVGFYHTSTGPLVTEAVGVDADGNAYVTGTFLGQMVLNDVDSMVGFYSFGNRDIFVAKYSSQGDFVWAKQIGGDDNQFVDDICVDQFGNQYITGYFVGESDFDPSADQEILTETGGGDIFILKLDADGNFKWVKRIPTGRGYAITLDDFGHVYTTGQFGGDPDFDPGPGIFTFPGNSSIQNGFVLKLDTAGNFKWAHRIQDGSGTTVRGLAIKTDSDGNVITMGEFEGTVDFDPTAVDDELESFGEDDTFMTKLDSAGNYIWTRQFGGEDIDFAGDLAIGPNNEIYSTGAVWGTSDLNPGPGVYNLSSSGTGSNWETYISKISAAGNFIWAKSVGGPENDEGQSIVVDSLGNCFVAGNYRNVADMYPGNLTYELPETSTYRYYILKLTPSGDFDWTATTGFDGSSVNMDIVLSQNGAFYLAGRYSDVIDFDPGPDTLSSESLTNALFFSTSKGFVQKFNICDLSPSTVTVNACNGYTSPSGNFNWYTSGTYVDILPNSFGCDSVVTIDLTIHQGTTTYDTVYPLVCNAYTSPSGNHVWTESGVYTDTLVNATYCDSIVTIDLTVTNGSPSYDSVAVVGCQQFESPSGNYQWTSNGVYNDTIPNYLGCDSIITIDLTIVNIDTSVLSNGYTLFANEAIADLQWFDCNALSPITNATGMEFTPTESGNYSVIVEQNGCIDTSACYPITVTDCFASFTLYPDPQTPHNWFALDSSQGVPPLTYNWNWGDGNSSTGLNASHTYDTAGYYNICLSITDAIGCMDTYCDNSTYIYKTMQMVTVNVVSELTIGIGEVQYDKPVSYYPNPTSGNIVIDIGIVSNNLTVNAYNMLGELVQTETITTNGLIEYNMPKEKGIYLIQLLYPDGSISYLKVVKE